MTRAESQRAEALVLELAGGTNKLQELQEQVQVLSGFLDSVSQAAGETCSRMEKFTRQKTGNRQLQQGSGGASSGGAGSSGAGSSGTGGSGAAGQRGSPHQPGWAPRRSKEHFAYLQSKMMCARCFSDAKHDYKACTATPKPQNAVPPGYTESG